jgi:ketosteroid isomerase-like protein
MINYKNIIKLYLQALEAGSYENVTKLFNEDSVVYSPLYGKMLASDFYRDLFKDTAESKITLLDIFHNEDFSAAAIHFKYHWKLVSGEDVPFEVVDVIKFTDNGLIKEIKIIYDTAATKSGFDRLKS